MLKLANLGKLDDNQKAGSRQRPRKGGNKMGNNPVVKMHKRLGCYGCIFANPQTVGKDACCGHEGSIEVDENGKCKVRKRKASSDSESPRASHKEVPK